MKQAVSLSALNPRDSFREVKNPAGDAPRKGSRDSPGINARHEISASRGENLHSVQVENRVEAIRVS